VNGRFFFGNRWSEATPQAFYFGSEPVQAGKTGWETKQGRPGIHEIRAARERGTLLFHLLAKQEQFIEIAGIIE